MASDRDRGVNIRDSNGREDTVAREKMLALAQLAGGIAHDLNNLLMAIRGNGEMIQLSLDERGLLNDDDLRSSLADLQTATKLGRELSERLLVFGRRRIAPARRIGADELASAIGSRCAETEGPDHPLRVELGARVEGAGCHVRGDREQLLRCLDALIENACDSSKPGAGVTVRVDLVELDERVDGELPVDAGAHLLVEVQDQGRGMEADVRRRMFEPFFSTKAPAPGRGIGLAAVWSVVESCGGGLTVDSKPGEGTRVRIYLPTHADGEDEPAVEQAAPSLDAPAQVLVVEDLDAVRRVFVRGLRRAGFEVVAAPDGESALATAAELERVDLLVSDLVMPGLSGFELAEQLSARFPDLRVLFVSGHAELEDAPDEDFEFLAKPFSIQELVARVRKLISSS